DTSAALRESPLLDADEDAGEELAAAADDVSPIDPSFLEVRRVAAVMRDVLPDAYLESLLQDITAEQIDIGEPSAQTRTPRRMREPRRRVVPASADDADDFQLRFDEQHSDAPETVDALPDEEADMETDGSSGHSRSRRHLRRGRSRDTARAAPDSFENTTEELAHQFTQMLQGTQGRIRYKQQAENAQAGTSEFRGRRGIAAEDPSELERDKANNRVEFSQSNAGSPPPEDSASDIENNDDAVQLRSLRQYKPLVLEPAAADSDWEQQQDEAGVDRARSKRRRQDTSTPQKRKTRRSGARRKAHSWWTAEEEDCFVRAVFQHGLRWTLILQHHGPNGVDDNVLRNRNRFNLKDKA
ncbi:hypothetical protein H4R20_007181, partial [Coemansia guatemalensis]